MVSTSRRAMLYGLLQIRLVRPANAACGW